MAQSGVNIDPKIKTLFEEIKVPGVEAKQQKKKPVKYFIMKLDEGKKNVVIETIAEVNEHGFEKNFQDFQEHLAKAEDCGECRFGVYDYAYKNQQGTDTSKLILIYWGPDAAGIKEKMLYSSTWDAVKRTLNDGRCVVECHDKDDLTEGHLEEKLRK